MKKFLLSATLLVAFSLTSFAAEKDANNAEVEKTANVEESILDKVDGCTTFRLKWNDVESTPGGGVTIIPHTVDIEICDDGSSTITVIR